MTEERILAELTEMIEVVLAEYGTGDVKIGMDTRFTDDLEMESIDLVALAGQLEERYGGRVNFAEFLADLELDEIIGLTVGALVTHVSGSLAGAAR
ncbi:acyl carrier protein [Amycolatopsis magusensis]|uniref:acyl carrier protein n=1 Tax=Amycolatopsis magusensis TaxID=882444 RepID=UPI0024A9CFEB|nr:phosphopantetheine-binding protein [Amycolatopsis magusensis]MDI5976645.1 phosphopantetheine-binding protein [Amycolatopsis magusensis]